MVSRRRGHIVAVSSIQGLIGIPYRSAYAASKHALQGFCDSLRAEISEYGVQVTVVSPGYIKTKLSENALTPDGRPHGGKKTYSRDLMRRNVRRYPTAQSVFSP